ncbi:MAG: Amino-acid acetyltransferase, mitochondrial [Chrysothrix sp. TS-e1954]|nr:MAG: Amino-acid acetyltransferase, mitochondrial [Chrysothrix sp. TS-e1954]
MESWKRLFNASIWNTHCKSVGAASLCSTSPCLNTRRGRGLSSQSCEPDSVQKGKAKELLAERDFFFSVLNASATKRDAKSYLSRFNNGRNLSKGNYVGAGRHVSLVRIRAVNLLSDVTIRGLVQTFSQLTKLGIGCIIVTDQGDDGLTDSLKSSVDSREAAVAVAERLVRALQQEPTVSARRLDDAFGTTVLSGPDPASVPVRGEVEVQYPSLLRETLKSGTIPVIPPLSFSTDTQAAHMVNPDSILLALVRALSGWKSPTDALEQKDHSESQSSMPNAGLVLDRIIVLDPLGGIPSLRRPNRAHVFVNLEQEYQDIRSELLVQAEESSDSSTNDLQVPQQRFPNFDANQLIQEQTSPTIGGFSRFSLDRHVQNLDLLNQSLSILPPSASAILTTAEEAATLTSEADKSIDIEVRTRRPKNPLIFNLLTDKPLISSSLPLARLSTPTTHPITTPVGATLIKRGMPLTLIPDPRTHPWTPPTDPSTNTLTLENPRIDLPRLITLIEDSFSRPLDVNHYLSRIRNRTAGLIIAGAYEGGAILTWELPPHVADDGSPASQARLVPYLDKFAVLKRSQGAGGVADIVFSAMVRTCFPEGVCWRSRRGNPVNKWYFERSVGTWKVEGTGWSMFWTTEGLSRERWRDYEAVCRSVKPSWADGKEVLD